MFRPILRTAAALILALPALTSSWAASTARVALPEATAAAQMWPGDAALTHVSTLVGRGDGRADQWLYTFYSARTKKSALVTARDRRIEIDVDVLNTSTTPLAADFLDSDKVAEAALKAGLKYPKNARELGLAISVGLAGTGRPTLIWSVVVPRENGFSTAILAGRDGALIKLDEVKYNQ